MRWAIFLGRSERWWFPPRADLPNFNYPWYTFPICTYPLVQTSAPGGLASSHYLHRRAPASPRACIWYNNNATGENVYIYIIYIKQKKFFDFLYILIKNYNLWWLKCSFFESTYIKIYIFCIYSVLFEGIYGVL